MRYRKGPTIETVKAIPQTTAQEWISVAYVEAIAAQAGLNIKDCRWDDGVDMDIGSNKKLPGFPNIRNLYLVLQLKSTMDWEVKNDHIHFALKASNYTMLRDPASYLPQYLVLYTMPMSRIQWIRHENINYYRCKDCGTKWQHISESAAGGRGRFWPVVD